jgi:arsenate reductase-like glutaredoxin family protein
MIRKPIIVAKKKKLYRCYTCSYLENGVLTDGMIRKPIIVAKKKKLYRNNGTVSFSLLQ